MATKAQDDRDAMVETLIATMSRDDAPWQKDWSQREIVGLLPHNGTTGRPYSGMNVLWLWMVAASKGYTSQRWATFNQIKQHGGNIKGEKSTPIVFWSPIPEDKRRENGPPGFWKSFNVFNFNQITGGDFPEALPVPEPRTLPSAVQEIVTLSGARIREAGTEAFYVPATDEITMPPSAAFNSDEAHAATLLHELVHWTGHQSRLDRWKDGKDLGMGGKDRPAEELTAEIGSFLLCARLGVDYRATQHAAYVRSWSKDDATAVRAAVSAAKRADDFLAKV